MTVNRAAVDRWRRCWALILRLRRGDASDALTASFLEPRVDLNAAAVMAALAAAPTIAVPEPDDDVGDAAWSLPEVLPVNAELILWRNLPNASESAETKLLSAIDLARRQSTLSWELRSAMSLARLWDRRGRRAEARDLLAATYGRFTQGFDTIDLVNARQLMAEWS